MNPTTFSPAAKLSRAVPPASKQKPGVVDSGPVTNPDAFGPGPMLESISLAKWQPRFSDARFEAMDRAQEKY